MLDSWLHDVRYAARLLRRNPLFALTAVVSLAIGIGANTTIFTIANALLFKRPIGVEQPDRLVDIGRSQNGSGFDTNSYPNYLDIRSRNTVFSSVYAYNIEPQPMSLGSESGAERIFGHVVTLSYFVTLGARPFAGRLFTMNDSEQEGASPFLVLSHRLWTRRFNADPGIVGRKVDLNGFPFTVIGIAQEGFQGTTILAPDVWVPMTMLAEATPRRLSSALKSRDSVWLVMAARLKPGVSVKQAQAELASLGSALEREYPRENRGKGLRVVASSPIPGNGAPVAAFLAILMGVVGLVLAIACVNVAGVLLARAAARRREIAVRLAIGAGRWRLIRQMLVETALLFLTGAAAGLLLARVMTDLIVAMLPTLPFQVGVSIALDGRATAFAIGLSLVSAVLSGLVPAFHASRAEVITGLKPDAQSAPDRLRLRNAFVVAQVAFSIVLVVGAGLFVRALQRAAAMDPGFDPRGVELAALDLSLAGYTDVTGRAFAHDLVARVRTLPGVETATISAVLPLGMSRMGLGPLAVPGATPPGGREFFDADWNIVEPGYFATMKMPLVAGRDFTDTDGATAPAVVIVNETAAQRLWPGQRAIGKTLIQQTGLPGAGATRTLTVVGIARDAKYASLGDEPTTFVFVPLQQQYRSRMTIVARASHGQRLATDIRRLLASMNPNLPVVTSQTLEDFTAIGLVPQRVAASVSGSLGIVGLLLAAIGIYGVTAYMVTSRTREIGIRVALGAQRGAVVRMVLRQGMTLALIGVGVGLLLAAGASRLLGSLLFGIGPTDPIAFGGAAALFCAIGLVACYVPARRATEIDAMEALRYE